MKTILVTGGSGYVGSVVCKMLVEEGYNVINVDRASVPKSQQIEGVTCFHYDIANNNEMRGMLKLSKPDAVIHLAASPSAPKSVISPADTYQNNTANTINLLHHLVEFNVKHFIFSSTSSVYGGAAGVSEDSSNPLSPESPYGESKLMIEKVLQDFDAAYDFTSVALRYFNAAGTYGDLGYKKDPAEHVLPILAKAAVRGETFTVFGDNFPTGDGTAIRDYTHIEDIGRAHIDALKYLFTGGTTESINLGSSCPQSVYELIDEVRVAGYNVDLKIEPARVGDPAATHANIHKAKDLLQWEPKYTIEDIIKQELALAEKNNK